MLRTRRAGKSSGNRQVRELAVEAVTIRGGPFSEDPVRPRGGW